MSEAIQIKNLVASARRRSTLVTAAGQLTVLASIAAGFLIVVLLLGTEAIPPTVVFLVLLGLFAAWIIRVWQLLKPLPAVAQIVDRELSLNDTISTAYFLIHKEPDTAGPWSYVPVKQAASLIPTIETRKAFPFPGRRRWAVFAALAVAATACFIARYAVTQSLSIRPPLLTLSIAPVLDRVQHALAATELSKFKAPKAPRERAAATPDDKQQTNNSADRPENKLPPPFEAKPDAASNKGAGNAAGDKNQPGKPEAGQPQNASNAAASDKNDSSQSSDAPTGDQQNDGKPNATETSAQAAKNEAAASKAQTGAASNLVSKMKDALSSMMAKLNPQNGGRKSPNAGDPSSQAAQQGQQSSKAGEQASAQQGNPGQDKANSEESASGEGEGKTAEKAGGKQGQSSSSSQQKGADSQSGVGKQDGDKALRDAEQQQAMGKLAEILGKRSANLTGEMTVESPSGNQQLKTAYSQQKGKHVDSSSEINRNEVPLRYQRYVRDYMEQVQKHTALPKPAPSN